MPASVDQSMSTQPVPEPRPPHHSIPDPKFNVAISSSVRKFNLVVYAVKEKQKGSPKHTRLIEDTNDVSVVFQKLDNSISTQSIHNCTRVGKYSEEKCRPILV